MQLLRSAVVINSRLMEGALIHSLAVLPRPYAREVLDESLDP